MAVTAGDLIYPTGELRPEWFPGESLDVTLPEWLDAASVPDAATGAQADEIRLAYAYWRAYDAKAKAVAADPDSVGLEGMSVSQSNGRVDRWSQWAAEWRAAYEAALTAVVPVTSVPRYSRVVERDVRW